MGINRGMMSSDSTLWETPPEIFEPLNKEFNFTLDVCATIGNAKCDKFFTVLEDGLAREWSGVCWMNPPYGREIGKWIKKALESAQSGATVVCLVPARTDTAWWHDYVMQGEVRFLRGRVKFISSTGERGPASFPSAVVVFRGGGKT